MKKQGFTLIELLAVIVVLAVIAIIAIPIITSVIDKAKVGALKDSAYGILDSAEMYLAKNLKDGIEDTLEFTCGNGTCLSGTEKIYYKGQIDGGKVRIYSDSKIELCITDNKNTALKTVSNREVIVSKGTCNYDELSYGVLAFVSKVDYDILQKQYDDLKALVDQTDVTAEDIKEGKRAYANGEVITGTNKGASIVKIGSFISSNSYKTSGTIINLDISTLNLGIDLTKLTTSNFLVVAKSYGLTRSYWDYVGGDGQTGQKFSTIIKNYSDGTITITYSGWGVYADANTWTTTYINCDIYLVY